MEGALPPPPGDAGPESSKVRVCSAVVACRHGRAGGGSRAAPARAYATRMRAGSGSGRPRRCRLRNGRRRGPSLPLGAPIRREGEGGEALPLVAAAGRRGNRSPSALRREILGSPSLTLGARVGTGSGGPPPHSLTPQARFGEDRCGDSADLGGVLQGVLGERGDELAQRREGVKPGVRGGDRDEEFVVVHGGRPWERKTVVLYRGVRGRICAHKGAPVRGLTIGKCLRGREIKNLNVVRGGDESGSLLCAQTHR